MPAPLPPRPESSPLVGRDAEIASFRARLRSSTPAVTAVVAPPGLGKSALLDAAEAEARDAGWSVVGRRPGAELTVGEGTTPDTFVSRLRQLLDLPALAGSDRPPGSDPDGHGVGEGVARGPEAARVAASLDQVAPLVLVVDDVDVRPPFLDWLRELLEAVRTAGGPVLVVLAGLPEARESLRTMADEVVELGPLPEPDVAAHLSEVAAGLRPPLEGAELDAYAEAASRQPAVLGHLEPLFRLLATGKTPTTPPPPDGDP